jgi:hypothetical protein
MKPIRNAEHVLELLLATGIITESDIVKLEEHTVDYRKTLDLFHTLYCTRDHPSNCKYYVEEQMDNFMKRPDHIEWSNKMLTFMSNCGIELHDELLTALGLVMQSMPPYNVLCLITALGVGLDNFTYGMATELLSVVPASSALLASHELESSEESGQ